MPIKRMWKKLSGKQENRNLLRPELIQKDLGPNDFHPVADVIKELENSLGEVYVTSLQKRVLKENPKWTEVDFKARFLELKRFFVMTNVLKSVPMFSEEVDEVWHEMLMFTKEYQDFCNEFVGEMIHHKPNMEVQPMPNERAFFDLFYTQLFEVTENSRILWGNFFRNPLNKEFLEEFRSLSEEDLIEKYFRANEKNLSLVKSLVQRIKVLVTEATDKKLNDFEHKNLDYRSDKYQESILFFVFLSMYTEPSAYAETLNAVSRQEEKSYSNCSSGGAYCGGGISGGGDGGSNSCSGSSCSSSSCGSGCGGGCSS